MVSMDTVQPPASMMVPGGMENISGTSGKLC